MSGKITETQIYLFLDTQRYWRTEADKNQDNAITSYEFTSYLKDNWDLYSDVSNDVISNFWKTLDKNINTKNDTYKLDETELNRAQCQMEAVKHLKELVSDLKAPDGVDAEQWKEIVLDELNSKTMQYLDTMPADSFNLTDSMKYAISSIVKDSEAAQKEATIQCYLQKFLEENSKDPELQTLSKDYGYDLINDKDIQNIVRNWVDQNPDADLSKINDVIKSYLATANIGTGNPDMIKGLGKDGSTMFNNIQKTKIDQVADTALNGKLGEITVTGRDGQPITLTGGAFDGIYKEACKKFAEVFKNGVNSNYKATDSKSKFEAALEDLTNNAVELFKNSTAGTAFERQVQLQTSYLGFDEAFKNALSASGISDENLAIIEEKIKSGNVQGECPVFNNTYESILKSVTNGEAKYLNDGAVNFKQIDQELIAALKIDFASLFPGTRVDTTTNDSDNNVNDTSSKGNSPIDLANENTAILNGQTINKIIESSISLKTSFARPDNIVSTVTSAINSYVDDLAASLVAAGYNSANVYEAADLTKQYYEFVISEIKEMCYDDTDFKDEETRKSTRGSYITRNKYGDSAKKDGLGTGEVIEFSVRSSSGKIITMDDNGFNWYSRKHEKDVLDTNYTSGAGLSIGHSYSGNDTYKVNYNTAVIIKNFEKIFNQLF